MNRMIVMAALALLLIANNSFAQRPRQMPTGKISGNVFENETRVPIEYANIILYSLRDSSQVTGTITDARGYFELTSVRPGRYYLEVFFLGYETKIIEDIRVGPRNPEVDLGSIYLIPTALTMEAVEVEGERPPMTYQIDKKVINVSHQQTAVSGSALEVLENVPSITVDIEGNVSLRGSGNFRLLIDGRPSILESSEALQQIPASSIETIEIITNPSAKYNPEGTAGIINIVMKKKQGHGRSGLFNLNGGLNNKHGGDFLLNQKNDRYNALFGMDYNKMFFTGEGDRVNQTTYSGNTSYVNSSGDSKMGRRGFGLRGSFDWKLSPVDMVTVGGRLGQFKWQRDSDENYDEWSSQNPTHLRYTSANYRSRESDFYALNLSYLHRFPQKGHELTGEIFFSHRKSDEETRNELVSIDNVITEGRITTESGPGDELRTKMDYIRPLSEKAKFEAGYQSEFDRSTDINGLYEYNPELNDYQFLPDYATDTDYQRDIHSLYALYSGEWKKFGFQGGLRGEYTYRVIELPAKELRYTIDRWDYFPTLHISYQFPKGQQFMASYTRRIDRPRGYFLEPFETWMDAYNVRIGNPDLKPEYIDSYEAGFQTFIGKNVLSAEIYYRVSQNKIERVRSVYAENITLHTVANVGKDYALGSEFMLNLTPIKNWNINLMGNLYQYRVEGKLLEESFSRESFNWGLRFNNSVKLTKSTQLQLNGNYNSPSVYSQGRREEFLAADLAIKQEFLNKALSVTLQIRDVFASRKFEFTSSGRNFYNYTHWTREAPVVMLNIRYNINNYEKKREREGDGENGGGEEEEF
ncbi:MAG: outer membrane beta-barrel family protein [Calditrichia bacterium]